MDAPSNAGNSKSEEDESFGVTVKQKSHSKDEYRECPVDCVLNADDEMLDMPTTPSSAPQKPEPKQLTPLRKVVSSVATLVETGNKYLPEKETLKSGISAATTAAVKAADRVVNWVIDKQLIFAQSGDDRDESEEEESSILFNQMNEDRIQQAFARPIYKVSSEKIELPEKMCTYNKVSLHEKIVIVDVEPTEQRLHRKCNRSVHDPWRRYGALRKIHEMGGLSFKNELDATGKSVKRFHYVQKGDAPPPPPTTAPILTAKDFEDRLKQRETQAKEIKKPKEQPKPKKKLFTVTKVTNEDLSGTKDPK